MPKTEKTRKPSRSRKSPSRRSRPTSNASPVNVRSNGADEPAHIVSGDRVTHVILAIEEYERLVKRGLELDAIAQRQGESRGDATQWKDHRDLAAEIAGDAIALARKAKGLTQKQLAAKLNMPQSQISRIERHPDRTTIRSIQRIADALGVNVAMLLSKARQ